MSQSPTPPPPIPAAPPLPGVEPTLNEDRPCIQCSYNLRGQRLTSVCPECGLPVSDSLRGFLLQYASDTYKRTIASGLSLILNGILLLIIVFIVGMIVNVAVSGRAGPSPTVQLISTLLQTAVTAMILLGYWRYTEPDPGFVGIQSPEQARKIVRISVLVQAAVAGISLLMTVALFSPAAMGMPLFLGALMIISLANFAAFVAGFIGIMLYTKWLGTRIPDARLVNRSKTYLWLLPVIGIVGAVIIIGPLIALVLYWNHLDRLRKHTKSILATGAPAKLPNMLG